ICNSALLAANFLHSAPVWLLVIQPLGSLYALYRAWYWHPRRVAVRPLAVLRRDVVRVPVLGGILALIYELWCLALYPYGSTSQQIVLHLTL
ncbi:hypothetical protein ABTM79_19065, partial [Acinetobacter baumannii]